MRTIVALSALAAVFAVATQDAVPAERPRPSVPLARLTVDVSGLVPGTGAVMVALFDGKTPFPSFHGEIAARRVPVTGATTQAVFDGIPYGTYAIAVFYDRNNNGRLDTRLGAIPIEPLGFSNNAKVGLFGPPAYEAAAFRLASKERTVDITVK